MGQHPLRLSMTVALPIDDGPIWSLEMAAGSSAWAPWSPWAIVSRGSESASRADNENFIVE